MRVKELAKVLDIDYSGKDFEVKAVNTLKNAKKDELSFLDNQKYLDDLKGTKAGAVFISEKYIGQLPKEVDALVCNNPYLSMAYTTKYFAKELIRESEEPKIADDTYIGKGAYIGYNVTIGKNTIIHPNVTIYNDTQIGENCIIHAGAVIGSDGFGYAHTEQGEHIKIYHNGRVVIEDNVEIGANSTIDRAVFGKTIIREGAKIDNLVQIGHNSEIGSHSILVGQSGVSGSTKLGRNVIMGGQSAAAGHIEIGDFAQIAARGGVSKSIEGGEIYGGFPLMKQRQWLRLQAKISKLLNKGDKS